MKKFPLKTIVISLSALWYAPSAWAFEAAEYSPMKAQLDAVVVEGSRKDARGYDRVYSRDTANLYKGREAVETYKGNTVSDLLGGLAGVYSGDARNSGALDPNIRGVQGQGKIPVTIDGTEQAITVWRGYAGANNRNYIDPNIVSSVYVEKGPSFNRDIRSGSGGSVAIKTLDADDIVPSGKKYGFEIKTETATNAIKARKNRYEDSVDYRTLEYPEVATGGIWRAMLDDSDRVSQRFGGRSKLFEDKAYRIAAATKQDHFDAMIAYAYRNKGNYFSGKKGAQRYGYIGPMTPERVKELQRMEEEAAERGEDFWGTENMGAPDIGRIGLIYYPGGEVSNTSLETKSWLGKTTFRLPNRQTLKLGMRHTDTVFGEIMPSRIVGPINYASYSDLNSIAEWPDANVKQRSYNLDYSWKPEGSRWIDFDASLWTTRTRSKTNTAGGAPGDTVYVDKSGWSSMYESWRDAQTKWSSYSEEQKEILRSYGVDPANPRPVSSLPNTDGRFNTIQGQAYYSTNNRTGFNFSNRFKLHDKLNLTVMGDFQSEKLDSRNEFSEELLRAEEKYPEEIESGVLSPNKEMVEFGTPRRGKRREYNLAFQFQFQPADWLTLTAGARYTRFSIQDHNKMLETGKYVWGYPLEVNSGEQYEFKRLATEQEYADYLKYQELAFSGEYDSEKHGYLQELADKMDVDSWDGVPWVKETRYWLKDASGRLNVADNPLLNGSIPDLHEKVPNIAYDPNNTESPQIVGKYKLSNSNEYRTPITAEQLQRARKQGGSGWVPAFSATVHFTDKARAYLRYTESLRYPSIFEGTYGFSTAAGSFARYGYGWKPEHAKNWEVGYIHDLTGLWPSMRQADFRLGYFHSKTRNIIDRNDSLEFDQFDRQTRSGIELQSRFDSGRFFGSLGVMRSLKNRVCNRASQIATGMPQTAWDYYIETGKWLEPPACNHGGVVNEGYLAGSLQPRWSADAELGARLLGGRLESGLRFHWHSRVYEKRSDAYRDYDNKLEEIPGRESHLDTSADKFRWQAVGVLDAYLRYKIGKNLTAELVGANLTDRYYLDPMSRSLMPAPGRTIRIGLTGKW